MIETKDVIEIADEIMDLVEDTPLGESTLFRAVHLICHTIGDRAIHVLPGEEVSLNAFESQILSHLIQGVK